MKNFIFLMMLMLGSWSVSSMEESPPFDNDHPLIEYSIGGDIDFVAIQYSDFNYEGLAKVKPELIQSFNAIDYSGVHVNNIVQYWNYDDYSYINTNHYLTNYKTNSLNHTIDIPVEYNYLC